MDPLTDQMLLERIPADDAVRELLSRYSQMVYSASYRILRNADLADDAVQAVFLTLLGRAHELRRHRSIAGWLYVTAVRTALAMARSEAARRKRERSAAANAAEPRSTNETLEADVVKAITNLGDIDRQVLLLRYAQSLTHDEIGKRINLSTDAVRMRHDRAIGKLRTRFAAQNLTALLPTVFGLQPRANIAMSSPFASGGWKSLVGTAARGTAFKLPAMHLVAAAICIAPLAGVGLWFVGAGSSHLGDKHRAKEQPKSTPAMAWMDGDCDVTFETFHGSNKFGLNQQLESADFGHSVDIVNWAPKNNVIDAFVIPHLNDKGLFTCDIKAALRADESAIVSTKQQLALPVLATYAPTPGKPFYLVIRAQSEPTAQCFADNTAFQPTEEDDVVKVTLTPKPGRKEDTRYWAEHIATGPFGNTIVSTRPAVGAFDFTVFIHDKQVAHRRIEGTNTNFAKFQFVRPIGILCEIDITPDELTTNETIAHFEYWEFNDPKTLYPTKQTQFGGYNSRFGMQSRLAPSLGDLWVVRSTSDPNKADVSYGKMPTHDRADVVFRVKTLYLGKRKP